MTVRQHQCSWPSGGSLPRCVRSHIRRVLSSGVALMLVLLIAALPAQGRATPAPVKVGDAHLLHRGSVFDGPNGLFFGPDDRL